MSTSTLTAARCPDCDQLHRVVKGLEGVRAVDCVRCPITRTVHVVRAAQLVRLP